MVDVAWMIPVVVDVDGVERGAGLEVRQRERDAVVIGQRWLDVVRHFSISLLSRGRKSLLRRFKLQRRQRQIAEIVRALGPASGFPCCLHGRQQKGQQDADDRNHHQQFHECESAAPSARPTSTPKIAKLSTGPNAHHDGFPQQPIAAPPATKEPPLLRAGRAFQDILGK